MGPPWCRSGAQRRATALGRGPPTPPVQTRRLLRPPPAAQVPPPVPRRRTAMPRRAPPAAILLALAAAACALGGAAAAPACPSALSEAQCKTCGLAADPSKCFDCVKAAKPSKEPGMVAANCMVCGSLATAEQQNTCSACVKTHGFDAGCSGCAGAALFNLAANTKPSAKGLATAGSCYSCYAKAGKDLQATPACVACWAPSSADPAACTACVTGATGVPAASRGSCFGCYLKTQKDAASCAACLKTAGTAANAGICPLCAGDGSKGEQGQCYTCSSKVKASLPGVRWLCHFTGTADGNKPKAALTSAVPAYHKCLAAAGTLEQGQGCRRCMDALEKGGGGAKAAADACFANPA
ncbi:MAG: hypothetical protein J3K34DRAFT_430578 [Monoraphidium minutum]|nr:MAG: hypothetical protein J3K34DRAFT_430578 [Monoraphidium minutum]